MPPTTVLLNSSVWKVIRINTDLTNAADFRKALAKTNCRISRWAKEMLDKSAFSASKKGVDASLVIVSVADLGFKRAVVYQEITKRARDIGLDLCPNEIGPQLRLQYPDQPLGEWLRIAMEPIIDSDGDSGIFVVYRDHGGRWLYANFGDSSVIWEAHDRFVFISRTPVCTNR